MFIFLILVFYSYLSKHTYCSFRFIYIIPIYRCSMNHPKRVMDHGSGRRTGSWWIFMLFGMRIPQKCKAVS